MVWEVLSEECFSLEGVDLMSHGDVWGRVFWAEETAGAKAVRLEGCLVCSRSNQTCVARAELVCSLFFCIRDIIPLLIRCVHCSGIQCVEQLWTQNELP